MGGKIKPPNMMASIKTVVAKGKPGVRCAIQLEELGNIGPKKSPHIASEKPKLFGESNANPKGRIVVTMHKRMTVYGWKNFAINTPIKRPIEKKK